MSRTFFLFNDVLLHASGGDDGWGLQLLFDAMAGFSGDMSKGKRQSVPTSRAGASPNQDSSHSTEAKYILRHKFSLEHLTIVAVEDGLNQVMRNSFEIRTPESSFSVFAGESVHEFRIVIEADRSISKSLRLARNKARLDYFDSISKR